MRGPEDKTIEVKPCPFCGSDNIKSDGFVVMCATCGAKGPVAIYPKEALALWNKRAAERE